MKIGLGIDVHQLTPDRLLILGGVQVPFEKGLLGHSDADVLVHAFMDALLGAAGLGDIGMLFPDSDERYKAADSLKLLDQVYQKVKAAGLKLIHMDSVILAEKPILRPFIPQMIANIARTLHVRLDQISIKATTTERLGPIGRGEGMAAHVVVLLE